jgi:hypothetical protein
LKFLKASYKFIRRNTLLFLIASLTLGLAPFVPEPHLWGKIKWISGGAVGMQPMDWFDFALHGTPWVLLLASIILRLKRNHSEIN